MTYNIMDEEKSSRGNLSSDETALNHQVESFMSDILQQVEKTVNGDHKSQPAFRSSLYLTTSDVMAMGQQSSDITCNLQKENMKSDDLYIMDEENSSGGSLSSDETALNNQVEAFMSDILQQVEKTVNGDHKSQSASRSPLYPTTTDGMGQQSSDITCNLKKEVQVFLNETMNEVDKLLSCPKSCTHRSHPGSAVNGIHFHQLQSASSLYLTTTDVVGQRSSDITSNLQKEVHVFLDETMDEVDKLLSCLKPLTHTVSSRPFSVWPKSAGDSTSEVKCFLDYVLSEVCELVSSRASVIEGSGKRGVRHDVLQDTSEDQLCNHPAAEDTEVREVMNHILGNLNDLLHLEDPEDLDSESCKREDVREIGGSSDTGKMVERPENLTTSPRKRKSCDIKQDCTSAPPDIKKQRQENEDNIGLLREDKCEEVKETCYTDSVTSEQKNGPEKNVIPHSQSQEIDNQVTIKGLDTAQTCLSPDDVDLDQSTESTTAEIQDESGISNCYDKKFDNKTINSTTIDMTDEPAEEVEKKWTEESRKREVQDDQLFDVAAKHMKKLDDEDVNGGLKIQSSECPVDDTSNHSSEIVNQEKVESNFMEADSFEDKITRPDVPEDQAVPNLLSSVTASQEVEESATETSFFSVTSEEELPPSTLLPEVTDKVNVCNKHDHNDVPTELTEEIPESENREEISSQLIPTASLEITGLPSQQILQTLQYQTQHPVIGDPLKFASVFNTGHQQATGPLQRLPPIPQCARRRKRVGLSRRQSVPRLHSSIGSLRPHVPKTVNSDSV